MTKIPLVLVVDGKDFGGIEAHICQLYHKLVAESWQVSVMILGCYPKSSFKIQLKLQKIPFFELSGSILHQWQRLKSLNQTHLLHSHGYKAGILCRLAALGHKPVISTHHAGETGKGRIWAYNHLDTLLSPLSINLAVSRPIAARLKQRCRIIKNFVNPAQVHNTPNRNQLHIGFAGRYCYDKGFDRFCRLSSTLPMHHWHSFGDGELKHCLTGSNINDHGHVTNLRERLAALDLLVIPSRYEGLPLVALEAMAAGVAVVAFNVGDLSRLIDDQVGALVDEQEEDRLATAVTDYCAQPYRHRVKLSHNARARIETHWLGQETAALCQQAYQISLSAAKPASFYRW